MTEFSSPAFESSARTPSAFPVKPALAVALAVLADWLFYGEPVGISAVAFSLALVCGTLLTNFTALEHKRLLPAGLLILAGLVPAIEEFNLASLAFIVLALGVGLQLTTNREVHGLGERATALCDLYLIGPFRFFRDAARSLHIPALISGVIIWFIPVVLGGLFATLFVSANPLLEKWISLINPAVIWSHLGVERVLFWLVALSTVWPFLHVWWRSRSEAAAKTGEPIPQAPPAPARSVGFFGVATILRSLVLFNLLFALQTVLDVAYLWGNVALPSDVSYASYAHRGAYPLIVTALLAAGFVLVAMKPGGAAERSTVIRPLVYLWVAQNVLLVASSILRLDVYVQIYLLTWWRIAAFIWMLLVAFGLILIVARIALNRSDEWLIRANLLTLTATLYLCSLINFAAIIADYNVSHSREVTGQGAPIDINYLLSLGPQALPAIDKAFTPRGWSDLSLVSRRNCLVEQQQKDMASWRAWGFRSWRLQRTLDAAKNSTTG